jgi:hypothetical protein
MTTETYERLVAIGRAGEVVKRLRGDWNLNPDDSVYQACADGADTIERMERERATLMGYAQGLESRIDCLEAEVAWWREQIIKIKTYVKPDKTKRGWPMTIPIVAILIALAIWVDVMAICYAMLSR